MSLSPQQPFRKSEASEPEGDSLAFGSSLRETALDSIERGRLQELREAILLIGDGALRFPKVGVWSPIRVLALDSAIDLGVQLNRYEASPSPKDWETLVQNVHCATERLWTRTDTVVGTVLNRIDSGIEALQERERELSSKNWGGLSGFRHLRDGMAGQRCTTDIPLETLHLWLDKLTVTTGTLKQIQVSHELSTFLKDVLSLREEMQREDLYRQQADWSATVFEHASMISQSLLEARGVIEPE